MKVTVNELTGFADAIVAMYMSKRSWTPELDREIREVCFMVQTGHWIGGLTDITFEEAKEKFNNWINMALRMTKKHITIGKYIQISITTEGIHRAGQDDIDSHAERFDNRIIRSSTRLATFEQDEFSDYYKDKVMSTDAALKELGISITDRFENEDGVWVKFPNGYVKEEYKDNKDVMRGLYMLGIPSNFVAQISLTQFAHVYKERGNHGGANPEVKEWAESIADQLEAMYPQINRELLLSIEN